MGVIEALWTKEVTRRLREFPGENVIDPTHYHKTVDITFGAIFLHDSAIRTLVTVVCGSGFTVSTDDTGAMGKLKLRIENIALPPESYMPSVSEQAFAILHGTCGALVAERQMMNSNTMRVYFKEKVSIDLLGGLADKLGSPRSLVDICPTNEAGPCVYFTRINPGS
jgi:hypothetical protein